MLRRADCDTEYYLLVSKLIQRLSEKLHLKKLNDMEVQVEYQVKISNRFAALENLDDDDDVDTNTA
jgi:hypothetical protein